MGPKSQPTGSQTKPKSSKAIKSNLVNLDHSITTPSSSLKRFDPLTAFKAPSLKTRPEPSSSQSSQREYRSQETKGKEKSKNLSDAGGDPQAENRLWVDMYEPTTEAELAVHHKKVEDVRRWFQEAFGGGPSGKLTKYRRILALTGPAGTAKTTTIRVLAREMGFEIIEWRNAIGEASVNIFDDGESGFDNDYASNYDPEQESLFTKFQSFINRASNCQNLFTTTEGYPLGTPNLDIPSGSQPRSKSSPPSSSRLPPKRQIILLEDLPNILHAETQARFHVALESLVVSPTSNPPVPVVVIVSNAGIRGEASDERMASGGGWGKEKDGAADIRTVLSRTLLGGPYVTQISFNPIAPTLLTKALQALLNRHYSSSGHNPPSREVLDIIVESSNGDIRSAVMALQFACVVEMSGKGRKRKGEKGARVVLESVTRREQSLVLFHLMGKVLYNKRKGDAPSSSASSKDIQREKAIDAQLKDPPKLHQHLQEHERKTSRINVDLLYADSPIDSSLFSLYIHQNYTQFCDNVEECEGIIDSLSWVDSSGGEAWYQANPYRFHLLTLGTLHSLPSPVSRRSQKIFKPVFFESLEKQKKAWDGVRDARGWVLGEGTSRLEPNWRVGGWSLSDVAMELGGVLKATDAVQGVAALQPPSSHCLFSNLSFAMGKSLGNVQQLDESDMGPTDEPFEEALYEAGPLVKESAGDMGGWLDSDDIEDF